MSSGPLGPLLVPSQLFAQIEPSEGSEAGAEAPNMILQRWTSDMESFLQRSRLDEHRTSSISSLVYIDDYKDYEICCLCGKVLEPATFAVEAGEYGPCHQRCFDQDLNQHWIPYWRKIYHQLRPSGENILQQLIGQHLRDPA